MHAVPAAVVVLVFIAVANAEMRCLVDNPQRILRGPHSQDSTMTNQKCHFRCRDADPGHVFWGTEDDSQCFCGKRIDGPTQRKPESECNKPCSGNHAEKCGGPWRIRVGVIDGRQPQGNDWWLQNHRF